MPKRVKRHDVVQPADTSIKLIALTKGQNTIVDTDDYEYLMEYNWYATWDSGSKGFYAGRNKKNSTKKNLLLLHRAIMNLSFGDGIEIDHINGNTLDNRRSNLRIATKEQNMRNRKKSSANRSGYKGVRLTPSRKRPWLSRCNAPGYKRHIGYFSSKEDAAQAYIFVAYLRFGEFSCIG